MKSALQPYATAGVAIVGASLIAVTPVAAPLPDINTVRDVQLTSTFGDLVAPWIDQYNTGAENASVLLNNFYLAPGIAFQQALANSVGNGQTGDSNVPGFLQELLNNPSASQLAEITEAMRENLKTLVDSFTLLGPDSGDVTGDVFPFTLAPAVGFVSRSLLVNLLPGFLPPSIDADTVSTILNFLSSPASAIIIGELGPFIAPWVALMNSINDGDGFSEILANTVGAFFNGATLNLDSVLPALQGALPVDITHLDLALGGLLSPGDVTHDPWELFDANGDTTASIPVVGGSIFSNIGLVIGGTPVGNIVLPSEPIGPIGAFVMLSELYGQELGDLWGAAIGSGKGAPTHGANPPLIHFPTIPDDLFGADDGGAGSAAGTDLMSQLSDLITDWQWSDVL